MRVVARATALAAAVVGLCAATGLASGQDAPGLKRARVERLALSLEAQARGVSVRTRPLDFAHGAVYELVISGQGEGFEKASGRPICYDLLYVFDCASEQRATLHDRFALAGRAVKRFLTPGPAYTVGYALLYRFRADHTYTFLLQKSGRGLTFVQTCAFAPPTPCLGPAREALRDEGSVQLSFSTRNELASSGSFTVAVNRLGPDGSQGRSRPTTTSRGSTTLPGMAPQTPMQALAIIRAVVTRNADACGIKKWGLSVSGFPADWKAVATLVRKSGTSVATWVIRDTRLVPTNGLAAGVTLGC